jgi:hypothetical protein
MYKVYLFERTNQRLIVEIEDTIGGFADRMKTLDENFKGIYGRSGTEVGGRLRIRRSVVVVGGPHRCKGWLSPILLPWVGCCRYVWWQQWLKVVEAEGVGPVGWREKRRKKKREEKILGEKLKPYTLLLFRF